MCVWQEVGERQTLAHDKAHAEVLAPSRCPGVALVSVDTLGRTADRVIGIWL